MLLIISCWLLLMMAMVVLIGPTCSTADPKLLSAAVAHVLVIPHANILSRSVSVTIDVDHASLLALAKLPGLITVDPLPLLANDLTRPFAELGSHLLDQLSLFLLLLFKDLVSFEHPVDGISIVKTLSAMNRSKLLAAGRALSGLAATSCRFQLLGNMNTAGVGADRWLRHVLWLERERREVVRQRSLAQRLEVCLIFSPIHHLRHAFGRL
jgi:hypothetical protein